MAKQEEKDIKNFKKEEAPAKVTEPKKEKPKKTGSVMGN